MKTIPLTRGQVAIVDDEDYKRIAQFKWTALKLKNGFYAVRSVKREGGQPGQRSHVLMHRFLLQAPPGLDVDHRNGNTLDNRRRENLRLATRSQNMQNKRSYSAIGLKGAYRLWNGTWFSRIGCDGRLYHLGSFQTAVEAAEAYDRAAKRLFGEFARLNFP